MPPEARRTPAFDEKRPVLRRGRSLALEIELFAPGLPRIKEWAYAGIFFELTGAAASWVLHGDDAKELIAPLLLTVLAMMSWALRPQSRTL